MVVRALQPEHQEVKVVPQRVHGAGGVGVDGGEADETRRVGVSLARHKRLQGFISPSPCLPVSESLPASSHPSLLSLSLSLSLQPPPLSPFPLHLSLTLSLSDPFAPLVDLY